tara:strand:- start:238 stop:414 length:177 start_codon:yes stop_codon:yes gene_type:complete
MNYKSFLILLLFVLLGCPSQKQKRNAELEVREPPEIEYWEDDLEDLPEAEDEDDSESN